MRGGRLVLPPVLLALAMGVWGIRRENTLWGDEAVTYEVARRDLPHLWRTLAHVDVVHGLYYTLMHQVFALTGGGLVALRLPSVVATALTAGGIVLLGRQLAGPRAGLLAGLVFPLIPLVQRYAQEGRSYAMVSALVTWASCLLVRCAGQPARRWWWAGYALVLWSACLLHELAVLVVPAHGLALLRSGHPRRTLKAWAGAAAGAVVGALPLMAFSSRQVAQVSWIAWPDPLDALELVTMAVLGLWCARTPYPRRGPVRLTALALPVLLLPGLLLLTLSTVTPLFVDRYVLYSSIGFALLLGARLDHAWQRRPVHWAAWVAPAVALIALVPVSLQLRSPQSRHDDVAAVGRAVRQAARPGDGLLFLPEQRRVWIADRPQDAAGLVDLALVRAPLASDTLAGVELPPADLAARMRAFARIVVVHDPGGEPGGTDPNAVAKRAALRESFHPCGSAAVTGARITAYCANQTGIPWPGR
ncbi:glycosyltransferase family 39 protein [Kitasatospora sp. LaBMicrA B282]|uniref:glycosyltransferase family 39 protein n=1 Tax=Kitasatospora sp. LaBMicrA B282 TaxID=3420949 RepID=UPI003D0ECD73